MKTKSSILLLSLLTTSLCQPAFANFYNPGCGAYVGGLIGGSNLHYKHNPLADDAVFVDDKGVAGRLLGGFDINRNLAFELGYTIYQNPEFKYRNNVTTDFSQQSLDFLAKISAPISCQASLYAKGGVALVHRDDVRVYHDNYTTEVNLTDNHLRPMFGVGINYAFTRKVIGDVGYYRTFGTGDLEDADFYGAGLTFRLG